MIKSQNQLLPLMCSTLVHYCRYMQQHKALSDYARAVCNYTSFDALAICDSACERSQLTPSNVLTSSDCTVPGSMQATVTALPSGFERGM